MILRAEFNASSFHRASTNHQGGCIQDASTTNNVYEKTELTVYRGANEMRNSYQYEPNHSQKEGLMDDIGYL